MDILKFREDMGHERNGKQKLALLRIELHFYTYKNAIICVMYKGKEEENYFFKGQIWS